MASRPNLPGFVRNRSQREWNPEPGSLGRKQGFMRTADGVMLEASADSRRGGGQGGQAGPGAATRTLSASIMSVGGQIASSDMSASELRSRAKAADVAAAVPPSRWITHEGLVLQFTAQFTESVGDAGGETSRIRDVVINYYLVDDTLEVIERKQANSGLAQGTILRRAQVPVSAASAGAAFALGDDACITWRDLVVGGTVVAYGIEYKILDCNASTRSWLQQQGVQVAAAVPRQVDAYIEARAADRRKDAKQPRSPIKAYIEAALGNTTDLSTRQAFQDHGRTVLSFDAVWDASSLDQRAEDGASTIDPRDRMRRYILNYYVATDQIEVLESRDGDGHDPFPSFLRAQKLPRPEADMCAPPYGRDGIRTGAAADGRDFVHWRDLSIGGKVRVFGRDLVLTKANASTRKFYAENGFAGEPARALDPDIEVKTGAAALPQKQYERAVPPPTGYGSEADSLASWKSVVPKPPKTAFELCNGNMDPTIFKFTAQLQSRRVEDQMRTFTIFYFFGDKTACIVEKPVRNSGFTGGTFLSRRAVKNGFTGADLRPEEMFIGATLLLNCFTFILTGADEGTLKYCEAHPDQFPLSDAEGVVSTLRGRLWSSADLSSLREGLETDEYLAALRELFPDTDEHALVTAARNIPSAELASKLA